MDLIPQLVSVFQVHLVQGHNMGPLAILRVVQLQLRSDAPVIPGWVLCIPIVGLSVSVGHFLNHSQTAIMQQSFSLRSK